MNEECGLVGIVLREPSAKLGELLYRGLLTLQHRGQDAAGFAVQSQKFGLLRNTHLGLIDGYDPKGYRFINSDLFKHEAAAGIAHVRYATSGKDNIKDIQPLEFRDSEGGAKLTGHDRFAIAHNGHIVNDNIVREMLEDDHCVFETTTDTEVLGHALKRYETDWFGRFEAMMQWIPGAYSMLVLSGEEIIAARDKYGFRPLCFGTLPDAEGFVIASETCALEALHCEDIQYIKPGEVAIFSTVGYNRKQFEDTGHEGCAFEDIYFARPDSSITTDINKSVDVFREALGLLLATTLAYRVSPGTIVTGVPDGSTSMAQEVASALNWVHRNIIVRNRYTGRTFIRPNEDERIAAAHNKYSIVKGHVEGKDVLVVDDSIVRGHTSKAIVEKLRNAGARSVHIASCAPPVYHACKYGIDTGNVEELIAANMSHQEIQDYIGADSLTYLPVDILYKMYKNPDNVCTACFDGNYAL